MHYWVVNTRASVSVALTFASSIAWVYVYTKALDPPIYLITQKGLAKLKEIEDKAKQEAKDEGQRRFQNKISVAQVLVPLITFILGLVVEHYSGLVSALSEFLGRWIK